MSAGKGDKPRKVDKKKYDENYDLIFRKKHAEIISDDKNEENDSDIFEQPFVNKVEKSNL